MQVPSFLVKHRATQQAHGCKIWRPSSPLSRRLQDAMPKAERSNVRPSRSKRNKKVRDVNLEEDSKTSHSLFLSYAWPICKGHCWKLVIGLLLVGLNVVLLFHNLDAFESPSLSPYHQHDLPPVPLTTTKVLHLRGRRDARVEEMPQVAPPTSAAPLSIRQEPVQPTVVDLVSSALAQNTTQIIKFPTPSWSLSNTELLPGQEIPYKDKYEALNNTHAQYLGHDNVVFLSPCNSNHIHKMDIPFGDFLKEKAAFLQMKCSLNETRENMAAKHVVAYMNFRESGYYGHAIDNIFPRVFAVMPALVHSGHRLTLVLPPLGKRSLSENTRLLCELLGIELRQRVPIWPHRTLGLSGVSPWSRGHRQAFQRAVWAAPHLRQARGNLRCGGGTVAPVTSSSAAGGKACGCSLGAPGLFLGRQRTRNSRPVVGAELLETELGFEVVRDAQSVPLVELAQKIHGTCSLVGFAGTAMDNLIFLPSGAAVAELNPYVIYANTWLWSHALGYCFCQVQSPRNLDQHEAERWASMILGKPMGNVSVETCGL